MNVRTVLPLILAAASAAPLAAQAPGSVFFRNRLNQEVDGNSFIRPSAVCLAGGPGPSCVGPGLQDGVYYFQITDPAGTVLLTPDPLSERCVVAVGGYLAQYTGTTRLATSDGPCGALLVQLVPFQLTPYAGGEYKLWLTRAEDYDQTGGGLFGFHPRLSKSDNFKLGTMTPQTIFRGHKFYDFDQSGLWNPDSQPLEVPVGGWRVEAEFRGVPDGWTFTDQDGRYTFIRDRNHMAYGFSEVAPNGFVNDGVPGATWLATTARDGIAFAHSEIVPAPNFGNVGFELTPGVGRSRGFWHNMNGAAVLAGCDPLWREGLTTRNGDPVNLRNPISSDDPALSVYVPPAQPVPFAASHSSLANWIVSLPTNGHTGYQLSREVAATILNNSCGFMQGVIYVDRFQDGVLVSLDDMLTGAIGLLSQPGAGQTGPHDPYQDLRMQMQLCLNEFGNINNTGDLNMTQVVYGRSFEPLEFPSPYEFLPPKR